MKIVAVILGIIFVLFLSERAEITVRFSKTKSISISLQLFAIEFIYSNNGTKSPAIHIINPSIGAFRFLLSNSDLRVIFYRGLFSIANRHATLAICGSAAILHALLRNISQKYESVVLTDPLNEEDRCEISCKSQVIIFVISLIIFVWNILVFKIRRRANYAGWQT